MTEPEPPRGQRRLPWIITIVLISAWCLYLYIYGPRVRRLPPDLAGTGLATPAPYDWTLHDLDGRPVPLASYRGKPIFLNIWATWCPPCVAELPSIEKLARNPALKSVAFLCVSVDESPEPVRSFIVGKNWPMTVLHATEVPPVFTTQGIPATFLIGPDGRIDASVVGGADWDDPSVVAFLEKLAAGKTGPAPAPTAVAEPETP